MAVETSSSKQKPHIDIKASADTASGFAIRLLLITLVLAVVMSLGNVNIGAIGQGLGYALVGVAVFITFRVLGFVDLTVDGAFPIGGAACVMLIIAGWSPEAAIVAAFVAGALTGLATALIDIIFKIEGLLASIIVITGAYTINLHIIMIIVIGLLYWFLRTEIGLAVRATGKNPQMVRATGLNHYLMIVIGLMAANGLAGLAGSLVVQQFGFADVSLGFGLIIRGLAAVIIGELLLRPRSVGQMLIAAAAGMLVFDISRAWIFSALNLPPTDIQLVSAMVVLVALGTPRAFDRWKTFRKRHNRKVI